MVEKIKNLEIAAKKIKQAVGNNERIIIYADSDADGICSAVILREAIQNLGGRVDAVLFPNREDDGYGINPRALEFVKDKSPAYAKGSGEAKPGLDTTKPTGSAKSVLFITLDLGITNAKEIDVLNSYGFSVIVVDHHQILGDIPRADIVIDPQQPDDLSESKHLANVGITFKLAQELLGKDMSYQLKNSFLELTALATISDMVPQIQDNKIFIEEGLRSLKSTFRPGLRAFLDILGEGEVFAGNLYKVIGALNSAESKDFKNETYDLLTCSSKNKAEELAQNLLSNIAYKQMKIKQVTEEVERRIAQKPNGPIIFEGDPAWRLTLAGPEASIICAKYNKPTFIFKKGDTESYGSVRCPKGLDSVQAMKTCADILITFGGHAPASGFRIKNENLEKFREGLNMYFMKHET